MRKYGFILSIALVSLLFTVPQFAYAIGSDDTTWTQRKHIKLALITYSGSNNAMSGFVAKHIDLAINPSGSFLSHLQDSVAAYGTTMRYTTYFGISNYSSSDYDSLQSFCTQKGYEYDSMFLWMETDSLVVDPSYAAASGSYCQDWIYNRASDGDSVKMCVWASNRSVPDQRRSEVWDWYVWKYFNNYDTSVNYGVMEDEGTVYWHKTYENHSNSYNTFPFKSTAIKYGQPSNVQGWDGMNHVEITDSLIYLKQHGWLKNLMDSLYKYDKIRLCNNASYGVTGSDCIDDIFLTGTGVLYGENMWLNPFDGVGGYAPDAWKLMDSMASQDTGYAVIWMTVWPTLDTVPLAGVGGLDRTLIMNLCWYYMAADYEHCYYMCNSADNNVDDDIDTLASWFPAIDTSVGQPIGSRSVCTSGTDGASQSFDLYERKYLRDNGDTVKIYYRPPNGSDYTSTSNVVYPLGGNYRELKKDGTLGGIVTSVTIRNAEGMIMMESSSGKNKKYRGKITIRGAKH